CQPEFIEMKAIQPENQPQPKGHYSPGIEHNGLIYVSGQLPMTLDTRQPLTGDIGEQTELALRNVEAVLNAGGSDLGRVLQMTIYVSDMELWDAVNEAYKRVMGDHRPARAIVPVKDLHFGTKIEIQAIAAVRD
ncbi:MAG: RidA family protein, partial [Pyrinomonadaceae bacterium]|nr:RidA family protein [Pyrinomonadaceae bacterium]